jgi:hypothetical protein
MAKTMAPDFDLCAGLNKPGRGAITIGVIISGAKRYSGRGYEDE